MGKHSKDKRDIYYRAAKELGYRARSAFKLQQIDQHFQLLQGASCVVDLCAAPGGWSEVCCAASQSPLVVAVDLAAMAPLPGNVRCVQGDLTHPSTVRAILALLAPRRADCVLCDCAPDVVHQADVDEYVQHDLVHAALGVARHTLREGGSFVCKVFRGPQLPAVLRRCQRLFADVQLAKPAASRNSSPEAFIVARQYRAAAELSGAGEEPCDSDGDSDFDDDEQRQQQSVAVPFVSCGDGMGLDADQTYPLSFHIPNAQYITYQPLAPAAAPIEPPYRASILRRMHKASSGGAQHKQQQQT